MSGGVGTALAGREEELAQLDGFVHRARTGGARLLLAGEPGIGKTTLWRAGVERARDHGFRVVAAQQSAAQRELSFAALGDLLSAATPAIGGLAAPPRRAPRTALVPEEPPGAP